jgi:hypothetical protein
MIFNPGLHALCFRGNKRGSEGYEEHINGVELLSTSIQQYRSSGVRTQFLLHNVLWANEEGLVSFYMKRVRAVAGGSSPALPSELSCVHTPLCVRGVTSAGRLRLQNMPDKASEFRGLDAAITVWNTDTHERLKSHPFTLVDVNHVSNRLRSLIRPDNVHYEAPMYNIAMMLDLNIALRGVTMCDEF